MSDLSKVVDSLEDRISNLLQKYNDLKQANLRLEGEIDLLKSQSNQFNSEIDELRASNSSLKLANSMLGSNQHKKETKLKINALVREIDKCIMSLSE